MTRTERIVGTAVFAAVVAVLISMSIRSDSFDPDIQEFLKNSVTPAMNTISGSIAEHPAEMVPP
jgi:hypothetical protein